MSRRRPCPPPSRRAPSGQLAPRSVRRSRGINHAKRAYPSGARRIVHRSMLFTASIPLSAQGSAARRARSTSSDAASTTWNASRPPSHRTAEKDEAVVDEGVHEVGVLATIAPDRACRATVQSGLRARRGRGRAPAAYPCSPFTRLPRSRSAGTSSAPTRRGRSTTRSRRRARGRRRRAPRRRTSGGASLRSARDGRRRRHRRTSPRPSPRARCRYATEETRRK